MSDTANADALRALIKSVGITRVEAAELLGVSVNTIHAWLKPADNAGWNPCPASAVESLAWQFGRKRLPNAREVQNAMPEHRRQRR